MLLGELAVLLDQGVDAVNHLLDELNLGVAQPVLVRDVVSHTCAGERGLDIGEGTKMLAKVLNLTGLAAGLSPGAPGLQVELLAPGLEGGEALLGPAGQVHVHAGPHARAQVGGAAVDVAVLGVQHEILPRLLLDALPHGRDTTGQPVKHSLHQSCQRYFANVLTILRDGPIPILA